MQLGIKNQKENRELTSNITREVSDMKRIIRRYELTDAEWERLKPYFPERQLGDKGRPRREPREILNGIFWIARSGAACCHAQEWLCEEDVFLELSFTDSGSFQWLQRTRSLQKRR